MRFAALLAASLLCSACTGDGISSLDPEADGGAIAVDDAGHALQGLTFFKSNVEATLDAKCSSCHSADQPGIGPDYLGDDRSQWYTSLVRDPRMVPDSPDNSLLLLKGVHTGPALQSFEYLAVRQWLTIEARERVIGAIGADAGPPRKTLKDALEEFGRCMTLGDWNLAGMNKLALQSTQSGPCLACHSQGTGGTWLSNSSGDSFTKNTMQPYILKLVSGSVYADGSFKSLTPALRFLQKGSESDPLHPGYVLTNENAKAVGDFYSLVYTKWSTTGCGTAQPSADGGVGDGGFGPDAR